MHAHKESASIGTIHHHGVFTLCLSSIAGLAKTTHFGWLSSNSRLPSLIVADTCKPKLIDEISNSSALVRSSLVSLFSSFSSLSDWSDLDLGASLLHFLNSFTPDSPADGASGECERNRYIETSRVKKDDACILPSISIYCRTSN